MTRAEQIAKGKVWTVHTDGSRTDNSTLFEGTKTACFRYVRERFGMRAYRCGKIRVGQLIWEAE